MRVDLRKLFKRLKNQTGQSWIEAELTVDGGEASDVKTALIEKSDALRVTAFNIPGAPRMFPSVQRSYLVDCGFNMPHSYGDNTFIDGDEEHNQAKLDALLSICREHSVEGAVLWQEARYPNVYRAKLVDTLDVVLTGYEIGTAGQWKGKVASMCFSWYVPSGQTMTKDHSMQTVYGDLQELGKCGGGMNRPTRLALSEKDIGRVFEIDCNGFASKGRTRHARFIRWRDDKEPTECTATYDWSVKFSEQFNSSCKM